MVVFVCRAPDYYEKVESITLPKKGRKLMYYHPRIKITPQMLTILK